MFIPAIQKLQNSSQMVEWLFFTWFSGCLQRVTTDSNDAREDLKTFKNFFVIFARGHPPFGNFLAQTYQIWNFAIIKKNWNNANWNSERIKISWSNSPRAQNLAISLSWHLLHIHGVSSELEAFGQFEISNLKSRYYSSMVFSLVSFYVKYSQYKCKDIHCYSGLFRVIVEKLLKLRDLNQSPSGTNN